MGRGMLPSEGPVINKNEQTTGQAAVKHQKTLGRSIVAQTHGERREKPSPFNLPPADFTATAMKPFEEFAKAQTEQWDNLRETNRQWLDSVQAEANSASEFISKLTAAHSIPDAMSAYQQWGNRRLELLAENTKHLMENAQKFIQTSARLLANGQQSKGPSVSS
jgi:hypothetical protein